MLHRRSWASWISATLLFVAVGLAVGCAAAGCAKRNLDLGDGKVGLDGGDGQTGAAGGGTGNVGGGAGGGAGGGPPVDGGIMRLDALESSCVTAAIPLPWTQTATAPLVLGVVASSNAVAVTSRRADQLDVRTFTFDGSAVGGFQFQSDAQLLPWRDDRFMLVARGVTGDFAATSIGRELNDGTRVFTATATATEHMLAAAAQSTTNVFLLTDESFVSFAAGDGKPWASILGAADTNTFKNLRIFGLSAQADRVLVAWGSDVILRLAVVGADATLVGRADQPNFFSFLGSRTATAMAMPTGLLMFDGNPVRLTEIGFDLSRPSLGQNTQLLTFYRTSPQVAPIVMASGAMAFWLTVFPSTDNSQGVTTHQLYGCALDLVDPKTCLATAPIAVTGLDGYGIAGEPVAAAALPSATAFAVAHTDVYGQSWLRIADLSCATNRAP